MLAGQEKWKSFLEESNNKPFSYCCQQSYLIDMAQDQFKGDIITGRIKSVELSFVKGA